MKTVTLKKEDLHRGKLLLVNAKCPCPPQTGTLVPADNRFINVLLKPAAANALRAALRKIDANDGIVPVSGYRSAKEQAEIFQKSLSDNGEEFTKKFVALPGHSEHETGLAVDLALKSENIDFLCPDFPYEGLCGAFREAADNFGFTERYAQGKQALTGIAHEPWHFRYVGYPHSKILTHEGLCLEEYLEFIKNFSNGRRYSFRSTDGSLFEVFYVPAGRCPSKDSEETIILLPENAVCQISGNNTDGFIVTVRRIA